jgi:hypothetical protein
MPRRGCIALTASALVIFALPARGETLPCPLEKPAVSSETGLPPEWGVTLPQIDVCTEDADCAACGRCRNGTCGLEQTWDTCMCHDECARAGSRSCDRSSQKPLCPGVCSASAPTGSMPCGRGDDTVRVEPFTGQRCLVAGAAALSAQAIVAWPSAPDGRAAGPCLARCAAVEAIGPVSELVVPRDDLVEQAAVTFAQGRWYVAWSGRRARATMVQRFDRDGRIDGPALRIEGTTAGTFAETGRPAGEILLLAWVPPAYTPAGSMVSVHRLTADLEPAAAPVLLRGPGAGAFGTSVVRGDGGELVSTGVHDRKGTLVREVRLSADARPDRPLAARDWWPGVDDWGALDRIAGQPYFLDGNQGALQIRALQERGVVGAPRPAFPIPGAEGRQVVLSRRIGDRWYLGAHAARPAPIVRVSALDTSSLAPIHDVIEFPWLNGSPHALVDGNGTPMLLGSVDSASRATRSTLVPLDFTAGAACSGTTLSVLSLIEPYQTVRALHFEGGIGGAVITAWGNGDFVSRAFFTRLRCTGRP